MSRVCVCVCLSCICVLPAKNLALKICSLSIVEKIYDILKGCLEIEYPQGRKKRKQG